MPVPRNVHIVNTAFGMPFKTRAQMWGYFDAPFAFAGLQQYRLNRTGEELPVAFTDVTYAPLNWDLKRSKQARQLFVNRADDRGKKSKADLGEWLAFMDKSGVSGWLDGALEELDDQGVPFGVELLTSPEINLSGKGPLFGEGVAPQSLMPFNVNQRGEREFLRELTAAQVITDLWPDQYRFNHRAAGSPAPEGYEDGLMAKVKRGLLWQDYSRRHGEDVTPDA